MSPGAASLKRLSRMHNQATRAGGRDTMMHETLSDVLRPALRAAFVHSTSLLYLSDDTRTRDTRHVTRRPGAHRTIQQTQQADHMFARWQQATLQTNLYPITCGLRRSVSVQDEHIRLSCRAQTTGKRPKTCNIRAFQALSPVSSQAEKALKCFGYPFERLPRASVCRSHARAI